MMGAPGFPPGFDFTDPGLCEQRVPAAELAELRRVAPVWWNQQPRGASGFDDEGYWVVTRHADVLEASRHSDIYSTEAKSAFIRHPEPVTEDVLAMLRLLLINIDPPEHTKLRGIISRGFTPRAISNLRQALTERAERIVRAAVEDGTGDFVTDVACELPLQALADLLGIPQEDRKKIFEWSNQMIGNEDPEYAAQSQVAAAELVGYSMVMAEDRKACPRDDIITKLVHAVDGDTMSTDEFGYFMILLSVAGNETTRNAITHGMLAFLDHPEQWELYRAQRPLSAVDEVIRWATPVTVFQRTALRDTVLGGQPIRAGDRVGLFYRSANFDEEVFGHPERFDILRSPNPHLSFGGTGTHYCLGTNLAKLEIELMFNAIADAMPGIRKAGDAERLRSGWLNGIKRLPVAYR